MNGHRLFVQSNLYTLALQTLVKEKEGREGERERCKEIAIGKIEESEKREREREGMRKKRAGER